MSASLTTETANPAWFLTRTKCLINVLRAKYEVLSECDEWGAMCLVKS